MNDLHEANRRYWETRQAEWAKRAEAEKVWRRCAKEPGLILYERELHWLGDVAGGHGHEFQWTVGDYISAVLTAGCEIEAVEEFGTGSDGAWELPPVIALPRVLLVVGRKR